MRRLTPRGGGGENIRGTPAVTTAAAAARETMAQPHTLHRTMTAGDLLVLTCRGCGASHAATKARAQRRYGAHATAYYIEATSRCRRCGSREVDAALDPGGAQRARR